MPININIKSGEEKELEEPEQPTQSVSLDARKTLDGNLMVFDHEDIDIVLIPSSNKIMVFAKDLMEERIYHTQDRFFYFLRKKGVIVPETVKAGAVYGSMEATIATPIEESVNANQVVLNVVSKFIEEERPYFRKYHELESEYEEELTDPDIMNSTELGEVPQTAKKGALRPGYIRGPYGMTSFYRYEE